LDREISLKIRAILEKTARFNNPYPMKKDLQLRYGFSVAIFYLSTVHFSMLNRQFFSDQENPARETVLLWFFGNWVQLSADKGSAQM
jgi:hypothetical protein